MFDRRCLCHRVTRHTRLGLLLQGINRLGLMFTQFSIAATTVSIVSTLVSSQRGVGAFLRANRGVQATVQEQVLTLVTRVVLLDSHTGGTGGGRACRQLAEVWQQCNVSQQSLAVPACWLQLDR